MKKILFPFLLLFGMLLQAQPYSIQLETEIVSVKENIQDFQWKQLPGSAHYNKTYFVYLQFYATPVQSVQDELRSKGILLIDYAAKHTYKAIIPETIPVAYLRNKGVRAIIPIEARYKIARNLQELPYGNWAIDGNRIKIVIEGYKNIDKLEFVSALRKKDVIIQTVPEFGDFIYASVLPENLLDIAAIPVVKWLELIPPPAQPEDKRGRSLHRINAINTGLPGGRNYTGEGIGVIVRDDGIVGPHIDFQGRIDNQYASGIGSTHGDGVSGILTGAGNLDPYMKGMAPGANLYVVNYESDFMDVETNNLLNNGTAYITNSSYGNGCNDGYTSTTHTVDDQIHNNPHILHVFSAGNSNGSDCGYGAGSQWGNITGGHKQGKNVIATANVDYRGVLASSSSHGPASDGRIKPDITANGKNQMSTNENNTYQTFGGTSGASPNIVGTAAVLYDVYKQYNANAIPESALIKATILNTANDAGNPGPDFKFGWGIVNAFRAVQLIEEHRFMSGQVSQAGSQTHQINVPANAKDLRIMLYWNDPAAAAGATTALINDLDISVSDSNGTNHLPWILNPAANPNTLDDPATHGADHLNNMEQVQISNPAPGTYQIEVNGYDVPFGPQDYFIVYEIITEPITLTYPIGGEFFTAGETEAIRWDSTGVTDDYNLSYSTDNGTTWTAITTVSNGTNYYNWYVPNTLSGHCLFKITAGSASDTSDANFSIAPEVQGISLQQVCPTQAIISCDAISGATTYEVYLLGTKYMELAASSNSNNIIVPIGNSNNSFWYAVRAKKDNDWTTERSLAQYHPGGMLNCSLQNNLAINSIENPLATYHCIDDYTVRIKIGNTGTNDQQNFEVNYQFNNEPVVTETYTSVLQAGFEAEYTFSQSLNVTLNTTGTLRVWVNLPGDENPNDNEISQQSYFTENTVPYFDDVELHPVTENADISNCWETAPAGVNDQFRWNVIGNGDSTPSDNTGPATAYSGLHYFYTEASSPASQGDIATLTMPELDLASLNAAELSFYYYMYGAGMGSLHIDIFYNNTWNEDIFVIDGEQQTSANEPWRKATVSLQNYPGNVKVRFRAMRGTDYSSDICLDDIEIDEMPSCPTPQLLNITNILTDVALIQWQAGNTETHWQVQYGLQGFALGNGTIVDVTSPSLQLQNLTENTGYDVYVRAICGTNPGDDDSDWIGPFHFTTLIDYCNQGVFYDSGGQSGNYSNNENIVTTIMPAANHRVRVEFTSFSVESNYDYLYVYDGPDTSSTLIGTYTGTASPGTITSTHSTGSLTFKFTSDYSVTRSGWEANVYCESVSVENINIKGLKVYPNPVNGVLQISAQENIKQVKIYDVSGREMMQIQPGKSLLHIDVSHLDTGVYLLILQSDEASGRLKFIKQ